MKVQQLTVAAEQLLSGLTSEKCKFKLTWAVIIYIFTHSTLQCSFPWEQSTGLWWRLIWKSYFAIQKYQLHVLNSPDFISTLEILSMAFLSKKRQMPELTSVFEYRFLASKVAKKYWKIWLQNSTPWFAFLCYHPPLSPLPQWQIKFKMLFCFYNFQDLLLISSYDKSFLSVTLKSTYLAAEGSRHTELFCFFFFSTRRSCIYCCQVHFDYSLSNPSRPKLYRFYI